MKFIPDCQVAWNQFQIFTAQTFLKYWHCYQFFLDTLFPHYEDTLSCLVKRWKKNGHVYFFFKHHNVYFFMLLLAFCLRYVRLYITRLGTGYKYFLAKNFRYQDLKSFLQKSYIFFMLLLAFCLRCA